MAKNIGGRTVWYCPSCGGVVGIGGSCRACGGGGMPEGAVDPSQSTGLGGALKRVIARLIGRRA